MFDSKKCYGIAERFLVDQATFTFARKIQVSKYFNWAFLKG